MRRLLAIGIVAFLSSAGLAAAATAPGDASQPGRAGVQSGVALAFRNGLVCTGGPDGLSCTSQGWFGNGLVAADVNRDGATDLVGPDTSVLCLGDGMGGFTCQPIPGTGYHTAAAVGLVDGDTRPDLVMAAHGIGDNPGRHSICKGSSGGFGSCGFIVESREGGLGVALGDIDDDGNLDAVFADEGSHEGSGELACLGDGTGSFSCSRVAVAGRSTGVAIGLVDGDSHLDAVFSTLFETEPNEICLGDGAGGFSCSAAGDLPPPTGAHGAFDVELGDVDDDGALDAIFSERGASNRVCLGDGSGGFSCSDMSAGTDLSSDGALGDLDGDGLLDAVFANVDAAPDLCHGAGDGTFTCSPGPPLAFDNSSVVLFSLVRYCDGARVTHPGTPGDDLLVGTPGDDVFDGGAGDDIIYGRDGNDIACGGPGMDHIEGGAGGDSLFGDGGNDFLGGGIGIDRLRGGSGRDVLRGWLGDDVLIGGGHADRLRGGEGNDILNAGGGGHGFAWGQEGRDSITGGWGVDMLDGGPGSDSLRGLGGGDDLKGGPGPDTLRGNDGDDSLDGGDGSDKLNGGPGFDACIGGEVLLDCD